MGETKPNQTENKEAPISDSDMNTDVKSTLRSNVCFLVLKYSSIWLKCIIVFRPTFKT